VWLESRKDSFKEKYQVEHDKLVDTRARVELMDEALTNQVSMVADAKKAMTEAQVKFVDVCNEVVNYRNESQTYHRSLDHARANLRAAAASNVFLQKELTKALVTIREEEVEDPWIGRTLKLKFIFDEIQKIGVLPEDHAEWILPMVEDVNIPDVSNAVRRRYLPSYEDAHMEIVDQDEETEIYDNLSRVATEHSEMLGPNPEVTIQACLLIQRIFRGFSIRKLYSHNPVERVEQVIIIQKMFRGFSSRGARFQCRPLINYVGRHRLLPRLIKFINTGPEIYNLRWVKYSLDEDEGYSYGTSDQIIPGTGYPTKVFTNHWFAINEPDHLVRYIRIPHSFKDGDCFDVHTGLTIPYSTWVARSARRVESIRDTNDREDVDSVDSDEDDARFRLAIHNSLDSLDQAR